MREHTTDILIVGGGTGGVAAAIAACERGASCVLAEPSDWLGGQLTSQGVPPDENQWIESFGGTERYQGFRARVRQWYRGNARLTPHARASPTLNPGGGWVSRLCMSPRVAHEALLAMLAPHVQGGRLRVMLSSRPVAAQVANDAIQSVRLARVGPTPGADDAVVNARYYLDASELGDLYPLAGVEHSIGAEAARDFGELHGRTDRPDPMDQQAFSWCFAIEHRPGEDHTIPRPPAYDSWRAHVPRMDPPWCGPLFSWTVPSHNDAGRREFPLIPWPEPCPDGLWDMWRYRRIVDRSAHLDDAAHDHPDVCLVNWVQTDYWQRPLLGVSDEHARVALRGARDQSLAFLYWMQTEAPRFGARGVGYPGLRLRGDELGTSDGFAKAPYIREPRRLLARTIVHEGHVGTQQRTQERRSGMDATPFGVAEPFPDSVGIGHYHIDLHPSTAGRNSIYVPAAPFRIPLGALVPVRVRNLLAAGKALGVTHITNGCYRTHAVEWNVGESAGHLAAWCLARGLEPAQAHQTPDLTRELQDELIASGVRLAWPWEL